MDKNNTIVVSKINTIQQDDFHLFQKVIMRKETIWITNFCDKMAFLTIFGLKMFFLPSNSKLHISTISTENSLKNIKKAKKENLKISSKLS